MTDSEATLPVCGHTDRGLQLTEIELRTTRGHVIYLLVCTVPGCPEYCRAYVDLRDPEGEPGADPPVAEKTGKKTPVGTHQARPAAWHVAPAIGAAAP